MPFVPAAFVGRPLGELLDAVKPLSPQTVPDLRGGEVRLHHVGVRALPTRTGDTRIPADHPEVDVPGVVLEEYLGGGGQGCVYAGRIVATGKIVAVKLLAGNSTRGLREALLAAKVRHPNVLRVLRSQSVGEFCVVIMELVQGVELIPGQPPADPRGCFRQLADAVIALGKARVVHRDVKPANVLVRSADGSPVLVDFGLAVDLRDGVTDDEAEASGTPFFLAPEAWRELPPNSAWDAYALGVTAAVVLARMPSLPDDLMSLRQAKLTGAFDRAVAAALASVADVKLRAWAGVLIGPDEAGRVAALHSASDWLAA